MKRERRAPGNVPLLRRRRNRGVWRLAGSALALLLLLLACVHVTPQGDKIIVTVVGENFKPIQGAEITIGTETEITDENGEACFQITGDSFELLLLELSLNVALYMTDLETADGDIKVVLPDGVGTTASMADLSGDLGNAVDGGDPQVTTIVGGRTENYVAEGTVAGTGTDLSYDIGFMFQNTLATADVFAVQGEFSTGGNYTQGLTAGFVSTSIGDGDTLAQNLVLAPVTNVPHDIDATLPGSFEPSFYATGVAIDNIANPDLDFIPWYVDLESQQGDFSAPVTVPTTFNHFTWNLSADYNQQITARLAAENAAGGKVRGSYIGDFGMPIAIDLANVEVPAVSPSGGTFDFDTSFDVTGSGSYLFAHFTPQDPDATRLLVGTQSRTFSLSAFTQFGSSLNVRGNYGVFVIDMQDGFGAADATEPFIDPFVPIKGASRYDNLRAGISPTMTLGFDDGGNGGGGAPDETTFFQIGFRLQFEGFGTISVGTPVSDGELRAAGTIASQASSCPNLIIAGFEGAAVVDACDGSVVKNYDGAAGASYFEALVLPTPSGESGDPAVFMAGIGSFLAHMGPTGDLGVPVTGPGFFFDSQAIGGDPANGVVFTDFSVGDIGFVTYDAGNDVWEIDPFAIGLADVTDGVFTYAARSAAMNAAGDELLVVGQANTDPFPFALLHLTLDASVGLVTPQQAVQTVTNIGALGSDPRRIRCDFAAGVCGVADFSDNTMTVVTWDGAPAIVDTGNVGDGPVGLGVLGNHTVSAGFNDDTYTVLTLDTDNTVMGPPITVPLPNGCENPGHAAFLDSANNAAIVSCNGDGVTGGFVYVPNAY